MSRFVYGSLMAPEVLSSLLGRVPPRAPACVRGFHRYHIRDRVYPAIARHEDGGRVDGHLLSSLTSRELAVLDWFEDEAYVMRPVRVELADGATAETTAYVYEDTRNLHGTWDYDEFRTRAPRRLPRRVRRVRGGHRGQPFPRRRRGALDRRPRRRRRGALDRRPRRRRRGAPDRRPRRRRRGRVTAQRYNTMLYRSRRRLGRRLGRRLAAGVVDRASARQQLDVFLSRITIEAAPSRPRRGLLLDRRTRRPFPREFERGELPGRPQIRRRKSNRRARRRRDSSSPRRLTAARDDDDSRFDSTAVPSAPPSAPERARSSRRFVSTLPRRLVFARMSRVCAGNFARL